MELFIKENRYLITTNAVNEVLKVMYENDIEHFNKTLIELYHELNNDKNRNKMIKLYIESLKIQNLKYNPEKLNIEITQYIKKSIDVIGVYINTKKHNHKKAIKEFFLKFPQEMKLTLCKILDDNRNLNETSSNETNEEILKEIENVTIKKKRDAKQNKTKKRQVALFAKIVNNIQRNVKKNNIKRWKDSSKAITEQRRKIAECLFQIISNIEQKRNKDTKQQTLNQWHKNINKIKIQTQKAKERKIIECIVQKYLQYNKNFQELSPENKRDCCNFLTKNIHLLKMLYNGKNYPQKIRYNNIQFNLNAEPYCPKKFK
jgi:hypothetical protein